MRFIFLERAFDEILFQFSRGVTFDQYKKGIRYFEFEKIKEWKSRFGFVLNIYSNEHFINNQPHFHLDNK